MKNETSRLACNCKYCHHRWYPYGELTYTRLPRTDNLVCPKCNKTNTYSWLDTETNRKLIEKDLGLLQNKSNDAVVHELKQKITVLASEIELEKKKREILEVQFNKLINWSNEREADFKHIEMLAEELEEEYKFKEDNK